jgi:hypothetical protein
VGRICTNVNLSAQMWAGEFSGPLILTGRDSTAETSAAQTSSERAFSEYLKGANLVGANLARLILPSLVKGVAERERDLAVFRPGNLLNHPS